MKIDKASMICPICNKTYASDECISGSLVRPGIVALIQKEHPDWNSRNCICHNDLNHYRAQYVEQMLNVEKGELNRLDKQVLDSINQQELISSNINTAFKEQLTFGQKVADKIAEFGGSWNFILSFMGVMLLWIVINVVWLSHPFDPFPFILLNLMLSCLAALQAPVIMMSQNRQEAKDRMRSEQDYRINLKAELEIRALHEKMDHLLLQQWERMLEIQQLQIEMMEELGNLKK